MLKLLLVLVPTVLLFGCRTSVPGVAGLNSMTQTVSRPNYTDPFAELEKTDGADAHPTNGRPSTTAAESPVHHEPSGMPADPFSEFQQSPTTQVDPGSAQAPAATTETSWYESAASGTTVVSDLQAESAETGESQGWRPTRSSLSAN